MLRKNIREFVDGSPNKIDWNPLSHSGVGFHTTECEIVAHERTLEETISWKYRSARNYTHSVVIPGQRGDDSRKREGRLVVGSRVGDERMFLDGLSRKIEKKKLIITNHEKVEAPRIPSGIHHVPFQSLSCGFATAKDIWPQPSPRGGCEVRTNSLAVIYAAVRNPKWYESERGTCPCRLRPVRRRS
jgi:hypothetical protein